MFHSKLTPGAGWWLNNLVTQKFQLLVGVMVSLMEEMPSENQGTMQFKDDYIEFKYFNCGYIHTI